MASSMTDFLQTFMNLKQVQNQTEQVAQKARSDAMVGMTSFMELAKHTADPTQLTGLTQRFADLGVGTPQELTSILSHVTPTKEALDAYMTQRGINLADQKPGASVSAEGDSLARDTASSQLTGANSGQRAASDFLSRLFPRVNTAGAAGDQLATALGTRTAAGMTPFELTQDAAGRALPPEEILQAAGIKTGTRMGAVADDASKQGWAQIRNQGTKMALDSAYQYSSLEVEGAKARAVAAGRDAATVVNLIQAKNSLMSTMKDAKTKNPTVTELMSFIGGLNTINQQLEELGLPNEGQLDYRPEDLVKPGAMDRFFEAPAFMKGGKPSYTGQPISKPVNVRPGGSGRR